MKTYCNCTQTVRARVSRFPELLRRLLQGSGPSFYQEVELSPFDLFLKYPETRLLLGIENLVERVVGLTQLDRCTIVLFAKCRQSRSHGGFIRGFGRARAHHANELADDLLPLPLIPAAHGLQLLEARREHPVALVGNRQLALRLNDGVGVQHVGQDRIRQHVGRVLLSAAGGNSLTLGWRSWSLRRCALNAATRAATNSFLTIENLFTASRARLFQLSF